MKRQHRITAPRVVDGRVRPKNRRDRSPNCFNTSPAAPVVERWKPGYGYRHILRVHDVHAFLSLLPGWRELARGLNAVLLAPGRLDCDGWHQPGVVAICAWPRTLWQEVCREYYLDHRDLWERLDVRCERTDHDRYLCRFTEASIRAFQLLHVLPHELGHHYDRMTTRKREDSCRGEDFAEQFAREVEKRVWDRYLKVFDLF